MTACRWSTHLERNTQQTQFTKKGVQPGNYKALETRVYSAPLSTKEAITPCLVDSYLLKLKRPELKGLGIQA